MKFAPAAGLIKGSPVGGMYLDVNQTEGAAIANKAASVIRGLSIFGAVAIGVAFLGLLYAASVIGNADSGPGSTPDPNPKPEPPSPPPATPNQKDIADLQSRLTRDPSGPSLAGFALAQTKHRVIFGVCLDEWIDVYCEDQLMSVPVAFIHEIKFVKQVGGIVLIDGSRLANVRFVKPYLSFCTLAGIQTVNLNHYHVRFAEGQLTGTVPATPDDVLWALTRQQLRHEPEMRGESHHENHRRQLAKMEEVDFDLHTETRLLRSVLPIEAEKIRERLQSFLQAEENTVKKVLGSDRYQEYLNAALGKPGNQTLPLLTAGVEQKTIYPVPPFEWRENGMLEIILRGCNGFSKDDTGKTVLGLNQSDRAKTTQVLFVKDELDLQQGVLLGHSQSGNQLVLPRQDSLARGSLKRAGADIFLQLHDAHPCCIYRNGVPIDLDSQVKNAGAIVFGRDDVIEIGEAYALRWHNNLA